MGFLSGVVPMDATRFSARLKEMRERAGLTQKQLADRAGVSQRGISHWEQGLREPTWSNVIALAKALGVKCDDFLHEPSPRPDAGPGRPPKATPATPPAEELEATA